MATTRFDIKIKKIGTNETMVVTQADLSNYLLTKQWEVIGTILVTEPEPKPVTNARGCVGPDCNSLTEQIIGGKTKKKKKGCGCGR